MVREGLRMLLEGDPHIDIVGEAANSQEAREVAQQEQPNLFLVDVMLGKETAGDFLQELLERCERARAILLTGATDVHELERAIDAGASGLVFKEEAVGVLNHAIQTVHSGGVWLSSSLMQSLRSRLSKTHDREKPASGENSEMSKIASLTPREREIVSLIATGSNRKRAAEKLQVSEATVRNHLTSILGKLELRNQFELAFYAQRHGLTGQPGNSPSKEQFS
jgi:DNA-binding NarL/FixJ family response regulator